MRPAVSRFARSGRMLAALLVGLSLACGGGGSGGQSTVVATVPAASPVASPQRPALASPVTGSSPVVPAVSASPTTATSAGGGGGSQQTYDIQSGDTLLSIAEQFYGDATQWRKIYDANRDVIGSNPDTLKVGTTLKIPPKDS